MNRTLMNKPQKDMFLDSSDKNNMYGIYQLRNVTRLINHHFSSLETLAKDGNIVEKDNYMLVYAAPLGENDTLETLFTKFNVEHPEDYVGHSLSVSDIIVTKKDGNYIASYCDPIGFKEIDGFMAEETEIDYEPTLCIISTTHPYFKEGVDMPFGKASSEIFEIDRALCDSNGPSENDATEYATNFQISYTQYGEQMTYIDTVYIGDGDCSILENIRELSDFAMNSGMIPTEYNDYWISLRDSLAPYLKLHKELALLDTYANGRIRDILADEETEPIERNEISRVNYFEAIKRFVKESRRNLNYNDEMTFPQFPEPKYCKLTENEDKMIQSFKEILFSLPLPVSKTSDSNAIKSENKSEMT